MGTPLSGTLKKKPKGAKTTRSIKPGIQSRKVSFEYVAPPREFRPDVAIAIIIPHRNRIAHLNRFFETIVKLNTHGALVDIYVIDQDSHDRFNRGLMLNIGFGISHALRKYKRFIFHDVDSYPNQAMFDYYVSYLARPMHFASPALGYKYTYADFLGGVMGMTESDYMRVNGFPNNFYGWGGEDDAFRTRCARSQMKLYRPSTGKFELADHPPPTDAEYNEHKRANRTYDEEHWRENGVAQVPNLNLQFSYFRHSAFFDSYNESKTGITENPAACVFPVKSVVTTGMNAYFCKVRGDDSLVEKPE